MPPRRRGDRRGAAKPQHESGQREVQPGREQQQEQQQQSTAATAHHILHLDETKLSVLLDEEDSYRLVWEHDEHLARIRAYTDFYDTLALLNRTNKGNANDELNSPNPHAPPLPDSTPTNPGALTAGRSESSQLTPFTSMDREIILATAAPPSAYETNWSGLGSTGDALDPRLVSRLEAEKERLVQDLQASQSTIQQLLASLHAAQQQQQANAVKQQGGDFEGKDQLRDASHHTSSLDVVDVAPLQRRARRLPRQPLAPSSSLSSSTSSDSRGRNSTPPSEQCSEPSTAIVAPTTQRGSQQRQIQEDQAFPERCNTQQSIPQTLLTPSPALPQQQPVQQKPIDVADFFWTLQVAPPPSELHERCRYPGHCHATAALLCLSQTHEKETNVSAADSSNNNSSGRCNYGTTSTRAVPHALSSHALATREEAVALACESAWVDSSFYCYNIAEEMSCLRIVRSWEDVTEDETLSKPLMQMAEEEVTRLLLDRTPATGQSPAATPSAQSLKPLNNPILLDANAPTKPWPTGATPAAVPSANTPDTMMTHNNTVAMTFGGYGNVVSAQVCSADSQRYRLPYLQRLWVTSVLRQYLLFLLLTISCVTLLIPGMMIGATNVFEAAEGNDFYATRNRFGRSALLVVARLGSCCLAFLFSFSFVLIEGGRRQAATSGRSTATSPDPVPPPLPAGETADNASSQAPAAVAATTASSFIGRPTPIGTLVHVALCSGAALLFVGSLMFNRSGATRSLSTALLGMTLYGAGEALLLSGIGTIVSAEVGVVASVNVSLLVFLSNWLLVNALGLFVLPQLSYYVYSPSQLLRTQVYTTGTIGAFVFGLIMLCPRGLIERAAHAHAKYLSPHKLLSAARHDVSLCFYLRALTVGLLTAGVALVLVAGAAVFVPPQAEVASVSESVNSKELMSAGSGKRRTANTGTNAGLIAGSMDGWSSQQRDASVCLFAFALLLVPFCFIPRLAAVVNRWCPVVMMTTLLCLMWSVSTASSWATVVGLSDTFSSNNNNSNDSSSTIKKGGRLWTTWIWTGEHFIFNPSMELCGVVTGIIYTIVVSSLLRSIANAGVQLPVLHPARWHMAFHECDAGRHHHPQRYARAPRDSFTSSPTEASPFLPATREPAAADKNGSSSSADAAAGTEMDLAASPAAEDYYIEERMRCVRMQLRGGPAVMTVLAALMIMIVLLTCVTVAMVVAALLTDRIEKPLYVSAVMPRLTWDEHLLVKTVLTGVFGVAMVVQWVEVFHRLCCSRCC